VLEFVCRAYRGILFATHFLYGLWPLSGFKNPFNQ